MFTGDLGTGPCTGAGNAEPATVSSSVLTHSVYWEQMARVS